MIPWSGDPKTLFVIYLGQGSTIKISWQLYLEAIHLMCSKAAGAPGARALREDPSVDSKVGANNARLERDSF
jgi:hypothetical protein